MSWQNCGVTIVVVLTQAASGNIGFVAQTMLETTPHDT